MRNLWHCTYFLENIGFEISCELSSWIIHLNFSKIKKVLECHLLIFKFGSTRVKLQRIWKHLHGREFSTRDMDHQVSGSNPARGKIHAWLHGASLHRALHHLSMTLTLKMPRKTASEISSVYVCWIFLLTFQTCFCIQANSMDPDQTAPRGAVWSGSSLFAKMTFKITSRWQNRRHLLWLAV